MIYIFENYVNLQRFAEAGTNVIGTTQNVNAFTGVGTPHTAANTMSPTMKTYYNTELLENARNEHYFAQFGTRQALPRNKGKVIEWRKFNTLPNADVLTEGVIPKGKNFGLTSMVGTIRQLGMYITVSDQLDLHAVDNILLGATEELGASAGETQDVAIRNVLMEGTNVMYADALDENGKPVSTPEGRYQLTGACKLTPDTVNRAVTLLKKLKAPRINGKYIALIHPSVSYDLRNSPYWVEAHKYASPEEIYNGEIGELHSVRFIESTTATVWHGADLSAAGRNLTMTTNYVNNDAGSVPEWGVPSAYKLVISEIPTAKMVERYAHVWDASANKCVNTVKIVGADSASKAIWLDIDLGITPASGDMLLPGEGGASTPEADGNAAVYGCLFLGKDAYGIIDPDGAGLEMITKTKEQIGGPLEQFSTVGYKLSEGTKILYQDRMLRVECCSEFSETDEDNSAPLQLAEVG